MHRIAEANPRLKAVGNRHAEITCQMYIESVVAHSTRQDFCETRTAGRRANLVSVTALHPTISTLGVRLTMTTGNRPAGDIGKVSRDLVIATCTSPRWHADNPNHFENA
jgi:hypothetical protein